MYSKRRLVSKIGLEQATEIFQKWKSRGTPLFVLAAENTTSPSALSRLLKHYFPNEYAEVACLHGKNRYKKGRNFEYKVRDFLKTQDYFVIRSSKSGGPADLVAMKKGSLLLVQCKLRKNQMKKAEAEALARLADEVGATPIFAFGDQGIHLETLSMVAKTVG